MNLDACGCCEPSARPTPVRIDNRPGLSAVAYRVGTFSTFRQAMLQAIAAMPALKKLQTRLSDDYSITLLEMWAVVADILTFYQERVANEGYLRSARTRDSVLRLARLLDYHLRPGVAATALLAFTLEKNATVKAPVGLKVQSVPGQDEKPQKFETLESILADARLNRLRLLPAPFGVNPLAPGRVDALLHPGVETPALAPGDRLLLFNFSHMEELSVRELRKEEDRVRLAWTVPIQKNEWDVATTPVKFKRTFRVFGYNAPASFMKPIADPNVASGIRWQLTPVPFLTPGGTTLTLDSRYEEIKAGSQIVIAVSGGSNHLRTVTKVDQFEASLEPLNDTVTRLELSSSLSSFDRRHAVVYELQTPSVRLWGYEYPDKLTTPAVLVPDAKIESDILTGRQVLVLDALQQPASAVITKAEQIRATVAAGPTAGDVTSVFELRLDPESAQVATGLLSGPLSSLLTFTNPNRQLAVTIGSIGPRTISLPSGPDGIFARAGQLQAALHAADPDPLFSQAQVRTDSFRLLVLSGSLSAAISFGPALSDATTVRELGLHPDTAAAVAGLASGPLNPFPALTEASPEFSVTLGPIGPRTVSLGSPPVSLILAASALKTALNAADTAPVFSQARTSVALDHLLIFPGVVGFPIQQYLALHLQTGEPFSLDTASAALLGNIALASHGEKVKDEAIGDGDASQIFQRFPLRKKPVTFLPSASDSGVKSSLQVLVNRVLWGEVPSLFGRSPDDSVYTARIADDGVMTVQFGDGIRGARVPSGRANIVANYRQGVGLEGRVRANSLTTLLDRPKGLKSVTNPRPADGGADPESLDRARENAPSTVRTFGRAVSLRDFEDLATATGEIAKARATWVWAYEARAVHLTIAGQQGGVFSTDALRTIHAGLTARRDPNHTLLLDNFTRVPIVVAATLRVAANRVAPDVEGAARSALLEALSFERLRLGQAIHLSDIYAVLQGVEGVVSVDIDLLHFKDQSAPNLALRGASADPVQGHLRIFDARPESGAVLPAEQAFVEAPNQDVVILTSGGLPG